jgi:hypothetical protein
VLLTTYRRDGTPVATPVNIVVDGSRAFFRTFDAAGKTKRLRNNPEVEVAPSTFRGATTGPPVRATTALADERGDVHARRLLVRKYPILQGVLVPLAHRLKGFKTLHYELIALPEDYGTAQV